MATVDWTDEARRWLQEIYDFIARDNPDRAYRVVSEIYDKADFLTEFPEMGSRYRSARHIRILLQGDYRIAYLVKSPTKVEILGVFHGALDIDRYLK